LQPALSTLKTAVNRARLLDQIGNTPLVRLDKIAAGLHGIEICAKLEFFNPGGSVKDRPALSMILDGERTGKLTAGRILIDATSGNTGIAYAMICAAKNYKVRLCLPANASPERKQILRALGAELELTGAAEGADGAFRRVREMYRENPDAYFYPDQYNNPANWKAHFNTTGVEILNQTSGGVTHFVALMGTSGTFTGVARRLKQDAPGVECWSAQPATPLHGIEGTKHYATSIVPGIYDPSLADGSLEVETEEAFSMAKRLAREEGLLVGISTGGNVAAALKLARRLHAAGRRATIVTIACDGASKYLSESFWNDPD
jgi:cysteine synthase B